MQDDEAYIGAVLLIGTCFLLAGTLLWSTRAAMSGRLGPNLLAGIRITSTLRDGSAWRAGHAAAWPIVRVAAATSVILGLVALILVLLRHPLPATAVAFLPVVVVLITVVPTVRRARLAAEAAPPGD